MSTVCGKTMNGGNTTMPLQWENRSPADVALQMMKKHNIPTSTWVNKKKETFALLRQWQVGTEVLLHEEEEVEHVF